MVDVMPAVAYQVHTDVLRCVGADYVNMFDAQLERAVNSNCCQLSSGRGAQPAAPDSYASLKGQAADWGYHAGIVVQPNEKNAIGITYHSKVNLRVNVMSHSRGCPLRWRDFSEVSSYAVRRA